LRTIWSIEEFGGMMNEISYPRTSAREIIQGG
jgi:hypothetical protein